MSRNPCFAGVLLCLAPLVLGGCAIPIAGALTIGQLSMIGSLVSTAATGKGLSEHALDAMTGMDCNILGSVTEKDRQLCEERGSPATKNDFKGVYGGINQDKAPAPAPVAARKPVLVRVNGKLVYTMAPVIRPEDIANAHVVHALPPPVPRKPGEARGGGKAPPQPVLLRVKGKLIYTMAPVTTAGDIQAARAVPQRQP